MSDAAEPGPPFDSARLTAHALESLRERGISVEWLRRVLAAPDAWESIRPGRVVCQGMVSAGGRAYLLRVFVDAEPQPGSVVTVYRTSKIGKYGRQP